MSEAGLLQLETGRTREPRLGNGMRLAEALGVDAGYLAFGLAPVSGVHLRAADPNLGERMNEVERRLGTVERRLGLTEGRA
jgi:hypothetical protein